MNEKTYNLKFIITDDSIIILTPGRKARKYPKNRELPIDILLIAKDLLEEDIEQCQEAITSLTP
jgi:hypothetical protein